MFAMCLEYPRCSPILLTRLTIALRGKMDAEAASDQILQEALHTAAERASRSDRNVKSVYGSAGIVLNGQRATSSSRIASSAARKRNGACSSPVLADVFHAPVEPVVVGDPVAERQSAERPMRTAASLCLEDEIVRDRCAMTAVCKEVWMLHHHESGRASDIYRCAPAAACAVRADTEVYKSLANPAGRRTHFEAVTQDRASAARTVAQTLTRVRPADCHRSSHYPKPPSAERLVAIQGVPSEVRESSPRERDVAKWLRKVGLDSSKVYEAE